MRPLPHQATFALFTTSRRRSSWACLFRQICGAIAGRGWALLLAGGALVTVIALAWYSAAFRYLNGFRAPGL